jgi:broad specificity phosphatase PhoE
MESRNYLINTLANLDLAPRDQPVALLMRHSIRYPILDVENGDLVGLTPEGEQLARDFGMQLKDHYSPGRVLSSPVGRCIQTARLIAEGAGWDEPVVVDQRLGWQFHDEAWTKMPALKADGLVHPSITELVDALLESSCSKHCLEVFVTHDAILALLQAYLLEVGWENEFWPNYLEGIVVWKNHHSTSFAWRQNIFQLNLNP